MTFRIAGSVALLAVCWAALGGRALGQFETRSSFFIGLTDPGSLIVGDFNGDGVPDAAELSDVPAGSVEILLGNGDGTFRLEGSYATKDGFYGATASLRHNGILDLVFGGVGTNAVYVMLGNGDGTFQTPIAYSTTAHSFMIALGDFTGDGRIDVADLEGTSSQGVVCDCIEVLPGNGDGTFGAPVATIPVPYNITGFSIAAGDFNNDGKLDIVVGGGFGSANQIDVLLGNGDGTFTPDGFYPLGASPGSIATGHFTSDKGKIDLAVTNGGLGVLLGNGDGTFQQAVYYDVSIPNWVIALDLDGDGKTDLAAVDAGLPPRYLPGATVLKGNGDGTFQSGVFYPIGSGEGGIYIAAADVNGDRKPDLLVLNQVNGCTTTLLNTGVVRFSPTTPLNFKSQAVGTTSGPQTVTLTNTGTTELKIQSMNASSAFAMKSTCSARVAPGAACKISATFSPTQKGATTGAITIIDNASSKPQVIELLGTGT